METRIKIMPQQFCEDILQNTDLKHACLAALKGTACNAFSLPKMHFTSALSISERAKSVGGEKRGQLRKSSVWGNNKNSPLPRLKNGKFQELYHISLNNL